MGLDCSHDAWHGACSAFNRLRQFVCEAADGSFPPHWEVDESGDIVRDHNGRTKYRESLGQYFFYVGDGYEREEWPGLFEFLMHSDCDGEISPEMCTKVADDLERLIPKMEEIKWVAHGHIKARGGYIEAVRKFIAGCRAAAEANEPLKFY